MNFGKNDSHRPAVGYHEQHRVLKEQIEIDVADEVILCYCQLHDDEDALDTSKWGKIFSAGKTLVMAVVRALIYNLIWEPFLVSCQAQSSLRM